MWLGITNKENEKLMKNKFVIEIVNNLEDAYSALSTHPINGRQRR